MPLQENDFSIGKKLNIDKEIKMVWSIANTLRGTYRSDKYKDVIIPMVIIRRLECALEPTRKVVYDTYTANKKASPQILCLKSKLPFYNTSRWTLKKLLDDSSKLAENLIDYIDNFSVNVRPMFQKGIGLDFKSDIDKMDKNDRLFNVIKKFSELDLRPDTFDNIKMGYIFEDIIRRFSENAEAGDHYTPREVIRLLVELLTAEGADDVFHKEKIVIKVGDFACGTGGMLSATYDKIKKYNESADVILFGQEVNPESYAICLADMLIKDQKIDNIKFQDTMKKEEATGRYAFDGEKMRFVIMNPPFGTPWKGEDAATGVEKAVLKERELGKDGRFPAGLPAGGDMQLLFMQIAMDKLEKGGRAAIISNGSPLFSGGTSSGESQIRRWLLQNDYIEAIIALPTDLFYNTGIGIYAFILSKDGKEKRRKNKIQLINAVDMFKKLRTSLGKKRKEITEGKGSDTEKIIKLYAEFKDGPHCKIFDKNEFLYREYTVWQPLQRIGKISKESIASFAEYAPFSAEKYEELCADADAVALELASLNAKQKKDLEDNKRIEVLVKKQKEKASYESWFELRKRILKKLTENITATEHKDYKDFVKLIGKLLKNVDGYDSKYNEKIANELSFADKDAVIQKDGRKNIEVDPATKDSERIKLNEDVEEYFKREVYPHIPDAIWKYESDETAKKPVIKEGAEFPFTRYFYEYKAPEKADDLLQEFIDIEKAMAPKIKQLLRGKN